MLCLHCNQKLNVKNIIRLCKLSDNHIYCKSCFQNHQLQNNMITCPSCNSFISNKEEVKDVNEDFEKKKDELFTKAFIATYCILHKNNYIS
jgi:hypothetical protein